RWSAPCSYRRPCGCSAGGTGGRPARWVGSTAGPASARPYRSARKPPEAPRSPRPAPQRAAARSGSGPRAGAGENGPVSSPRQVVLLGSTGSIGTQAVDIARRYPDRFRVVGLGAGGGNVPLLAAQALELGVEVVAVAKAGAAQDLLAA